MVLPCPLCGVRKFPDDPSIMAIERGVVLENISDLREPRSSLAAANAEIDRLGELYAKEGHKALFLQEEVGRLQVKACGAVDAARDAEASVTTLTAEVERLRKALSIDNDTICQILGKVMQFPWYKDDQENFPGATEADGICQGHYVAEDMARMAADKITTLTARVAELEAAGLALLSAETHLLHDGYDDGPGGGDYVYTDVVRTDHEAFAKLRSLLQQKDKPNG